ncbi:tubulin polyglutamylase complex subunit 2 isoform X2 [Ranitomeya imitator]|uniref:tubulin polyglutamylase complex subunit 2 isoform X2 n=1 Tax=Ranitomeya imitator TaxID=111125 RepID=UPI0037E87914
MNVVQCCVQMGDKNENLMASHIEKITLGISKILESSPGVTDVKIEEKPPAERHTLVSWEQKYSCMLPEDLKNFYLMTNGFHMSWSVKLDDSPVQVGLMVVNSISNLIHLKGSSSYSLPNSPTLADLDDDSDEEGLSEKPHFDSRNMIFELDSCDGNGKVCLVYKKHAAGQTTCEPTIWFLDRALFWHFLTDTFTAYYRILLCHLGLPQWQYSFTSYGLSPTAKQWMNIYKPITFCPLQLSEEPDSFINKLDPNKIFKGKNKTPVTKKKLPGPPTGYQKNPLPSSKKSEQSGAPRK